MNNEISSQSSFWSRKSGLIICSLVMVFYLYGFFLRVMPSAMTSQLMDHFHVNAAGLGFMLACFYYGYWLIQIIVGLLFD